MKRYENNTLHENDGITRRYVEVFSIDWIHRIQNLNALKMPIAMGKQM
jgi:hypothetical protein